MTTTTNNGTVTSNKVSADAFDPTSSHFLRAIVASCSDLETRWAIGTGLFAPPKKVGGEPKEYQATIKIPTVRDAKGNIVMLCSLADLHSYCRTESARLAAEYTGNPAALLEADVVTVGLPKIALGTCKVGWAPTMSHAEVADALERYADSDCLTLVERAALDAPAPGKGKGKSKSKDEPAPEAAPVA